MSLCWQELESDVFGTQEETMTFTQEQHITCQAHLHPDPMGSAGHHIYPLRRRLEVKAVAQLPSGRVYVSEHLCQI